MTINECSWNIWMITFKPSKFPTSSSRKWGRCSSLSPSRAFDWVKWPHSAEFDKSQMPGVCQGMTTLGFGCRITSNHLIFDCRDSKTLNQCLFPFCMYPWSTFEKWNAPSKTRFRTYNGWSVNRTRNQSFDREIGIKGTQSGLLAAACRSLC